MPRQSFDPIEEAGPWGWVFPAMMILFFLILMGLPWLRRVYHDLVGRDVTLNRKEKPTTHVKKEKQRQREVLMKQMRQ
jgi:hypothetical protein